MGARLRPMRQATDMATGIRRIGMGMLAHEQQRGGLWGSAPRRQFGGIPAREGAMSASYYAECSATVWIEGDGGSAAIKCQLRDGHEGEHERSGTTEFGKHWHLIWSVDS